MKDNPPHGAKGHYCGRFLSEDGERVGDEWRSDNPWFDQVLERMSTIRTSKASDYADADNPFSNFEGAARLANITTDQVFHTLIGVKVERLRQLLSGKTPNFESIEDTLLDLANYAALWLAWREKTQAKEDKQPLLNPKPGKG